MNNFNKKMISCIKTAHFKGGAEFAGPENDGPKMIKDWKMQDLKMTDQIAGLENARPGK